MVLVRKRIKDVNGTRKTHHSITCINDHCIYVRIQYPDRPITFVLFLNFIAEKSKPHLRWHELKLNRFRHVGEEDEMEGRNVEERTMVRGPRCPLGVSMLHVAEEEVSVSFSWGDINLLRAGLRFLLACDRPNFPHSRDHLYSNV